MIRVLKTDLDSFLTELELRAIVTDHWSLRKQYDSLLIHHQEYRIKHILCPAIEDSAFVSLKDKYAKIRNTLIDYYFEGSSTGYCTYCGKSSSDELDHFQPKALAPQYSLVKENLFWSCGACNRKKDEYPPYSFLKLFHPIFDQIFDEKNRLFDIEFISVGLGGDRKLVVDLRTIPVKRLNARQSARVVNYLTVLGIDRRVEERVRDVIKYQFGIICRDRPTFKKLKQLFTLMAENQSSERDPTNFFAFRILAKASVLKKLIKIAEQI
jgi:5-methylcytosine-specific restriction endonuclease McrA